ncbi:MAG: choice-of-anchor D domain-containing protein [Bdellovibrionales bacterium]
MIMRRAGAVCLAAVVLGTLAASPAAARDAAFMGPGSVGSASNDEAVKVEPKSDIDLGEMSINIARRTTLFFVNQSSAPVQVEKVAVNSDANVIADIASNDCTKQGTIAPQSRCSVEVSVTSSSSGTWTAEVLLTHNGAGRITRAKISGKTTGGSSNAEKKDMGLALNSKEVNPVNFGDVNVGEKAVRSALMVNDSPDTITIYSIDVIEAGNGLQLLEQGCTVDMELKPGESCPVTLLWAPSEAGQVSTDLIIRHSGRQGFAVVPVRGKTKTEATASSSRQSETPMPDKGAVKSTAAVPTPDELAAAAAKMSPIAAESLIPPPSAAPKPVAPSGVWRLIGTVGNKALLLTPDSETKIVGAGESVDMGGDQTVKVSGVTAKSVELIIDGKKKELTLGSSPELVVRANAAKASKPKTDKSGSSKSGGTSASSSGTSSTGNISGASGNAQ